MPALGADVDGLPWAGIVLLSSPPDAATDGIPWGCWGNERDSPLKTPSAMQESATPNPHSAVPHRVAVTLVWATFLLLCAGALVTTEGAGMAFRDWPTSDGYNMFLYPWFAAAWDKFIEHGHRLLGALVGLITIVLTVCLWKFERRGWVVALGAAALALVIVQGTLGGLRVRAD
ncbi:MAG: hypothetical protein GTO53_07995, partial [Planctomycetales bacterium]|nr:hypothetical protein [Planctomycetales bacterium]NIN77668.1 hypothetical protein [Planctomycetales bacterium]